MENKRMQIYHPKNHKCGIGECKFAVYNSETAE